MKFTVKPILPWLLVAAVCCIPGSTSDKALSVDRPAPIQIRMLFAGDVMQHLPQVAAARRDDNYDYGATFAAVKPHFEAADLVVVNLETTLTRKPIYTGYPRFRSPIALADALGQAGVDVAVLANNHCCDGDAEGVFTTAAELDRCGIRHTGVFADSLSRVARNPLYITIRGVRFALLNYTYATNGIPIPKGVVVNQIDTTVIAADLAAARHAGVDCTVAFMHWGEEYERQANAAQRYLAGFLRRHGADVVIGSHPHVIQPIEADSTHVVVYSLGNFVSNQRQRYSDGGLMATVEATKHPSGRMTYAVIPIPVWVALPGYRILPPEAADTMALPAAWRTFSEDTAELLGMAL